VQEVIYAPLEIIVSGVSGNTRKGKVVTANPILHRDSPERMR